MPVRPRIAPAGWIFHVLNRANGKGSLLFERSACYRDFMSIAIDAVATDSMQVLAYALMPNHWHLLLRPQREGDLSRFMHRLTLNHTKRWHGSRSTTGRGHLYQDRYKSFPVCDDRYLLNVCRYIEANPLRAGLVGRAEDWLWSSAREHGAISQTAMSEDSRVRLPLEPFPILLPDNWLDVVNGNADASETESIRKSIARGSPYGEEVWSRAASEKLEIQVPAKRRGRPPKPAAA
jgi:putative transposase